VGDFVGYSPKQKDTLRMRVYPNGDVTVQRGDDTKRGSFIGRQQITVDGDTYMLSPEGRGLRRVAVNNHEDQVLFRRAVHGQRVDPGTAKVPAWMVGTFKGYNPYVRGNTLLTIWRDGHIERVQAYSSKPDVDKNDGTYHRGILRVNGRRFRITRLSRGVRLAEVGKPGIAVALRRIG
jgi:hypothetical protein